MRKTLSPLSLLFLAAALAGCKGKESPNSAPPRTSGKVEAQQKDKWTFGEEIDSLTDQRKVSALIVEKLGVKYHRLMVSCVAGKLEAAAGFDEYLGTNFAVVTTRFNKDEVKVERWAPSTKGNALFTTNPARFARLLARSNSFIIESPDYRDVRHRLEFSWPDDGGAIRRVLAACNLPAESAIEKIPGLSQASIDELESWGPKYTQSRKRALAATSGYDGPIDSVVDESFAIKAQDAKDAFIEKCRSGNLKSNLCLQLQRPDGLPINIGSTLYEITSLKVKNEIGGIRSFD